MPRNKKVRRRSLIKNASAGGADALFLHDCSSRIADAFAEKVQIGIISQHVFGQAVLLFILLEQGMAVLADQKAENRIMQRRKLDVTGGQLFGIEGCLNGAFKQKVNHTIAEVIMFKENVEQSLVVGL